MIGIFDMTFDQRLEIFGETRQTQNKSLGHPR